MVIISAQNSISTLRKYSANSVTKEAKKQVWTNAGEKDYGGFSSCSLHIWKCILHDIISKNFLCGLFFLFFSNQEEFTMMTTQTRSCANEQTRLGACYIREKLALPNDFGTQVGASGLLYYQHWHTKTCSLSKENEEEIRESRKKGIQNQTENRGKKTAREYPPGKTLFRP